MNLGKFTESSLEEQRKKLKDKFPHLLLLSYSGFNEFCDVKDIEYAEEFKCKYVNVFYGRSFCKGRKKDRRLEKTRDRLIFAKNTKAASPSLALIALSKSSENFFLMVFFMP